MSIQDELAAVADPDSSRASVSNLAPSEPEWRSIIAQIREVDDFQRNHLHRYFKSCVVAGADELFIIEPEPLRRAKRAGIPVDCDALWLQRDIAGVSALMYFYAANLSDKGKASALAALPLGVMNKSCIELRSHQDKAGANLWHWLAKGEYGALTDKLAAMLLYNEVPITPDLAGNFPMHYLARSPHYDATGMFRLLVRYGDRPDRINNMGLSAITIEANRKIQRTQIIAEMLKYVPADHECKGQNVANHISKRYAGTVAGAAALSKLMSKVLETNAGGAEMSRPAKNTSVGTRHLRAAAI